MTLALAGLVVAGCNSTIAHVNGTVLDTRSNQPVAGAKVTAGTLSDITGSDGAFSLRAVPKGAKCRWKRLTTPRPPRRQARPPSSSGSTPSQSPAR